MGRKSKVKPRALTQVPAYHRFVTQRNKAAETILHNALQDISLLLDQELLHVEHMVLQSIGRLPQGLHFTTLATQILNEIDKRMTLQFEQLATRMEAVYSKATKSAYLLAAASETQAIAQSIAKPKAVQLTAKLVKSNYRGRIALGLSRIRRDIMDALEHSRVLEENTEATLARFKAALPRVKRFKKPPRVVRALKEAANTGEKAAKEAATELSFTNDKEWEETLADLIPKEQIKLRGPSTLFGDFDEDGAYTEWYGWEVEQSLTHDFVQSVRDGQVDAAREQGITEFVWIAVVDNKTDECCLWRDGLTISEIEAKLQGDHADDECEATVPPAHFNCRCDIAPSTDSLPEKPDTDQLEYEQWLTTTS